MRYDFSSCSNMQHAVSHGIRIGGYVAPRNGENNGNAKLSFEKSKLIRKLFLTGKYTKISIAKKFKVNRNLISKVIKNRIWI